ncbi:glutathione S-transferase family protein [Amaricoccus sp.]|uniref:glutathione S-transferase family protein n=1 Tax=Amaricoccus sp. TaxID=1872485 RepID=UPI001B57CC60|nr:glutathione S-transferase family protein [Amaricoccus sp.]MBP7241151.1 glutathione S-transferase family protein [Amaricoccus sp.]
MAETQGRLLFFTSSPMGRMARVLIREWALPIDEEAVPFFAPDPVTALNPLGQVPVLVERGEPLFPTLLVLERLWVMAGEPAQAYAPARERQALATVLVAGDALVAALYQRWSGLERTLPNNIGFDPGQRNLARLLATLDWLEQGRLRDGLTITGVAVACCMLWSDARGGPAWWGRPRLEALVAELSERESFRSTAPKRWRPGESEQM